MVGGYYDADNFYLVYQKDNTLYKYDPYFGTEMKDLASNVTIPVSYSICGFNYTGGKLNMYLTR